MNNHNRTAYKKLSWILPLAAVLIGFGCTKDYRSRYLGCWEFTVDKAKFNMYVGAEHEPIVVYTGQIRSVDDDGLKIRYTPGDSIVLKIDEAGKFSGFPSAYCDGNFTDSENLYLYLRWGGIGTGKWHKINAIKK